MRDPASIRLAELGNPLISFRTVDGVSAGIIPPQALRRCTHNRENNQVTRANIEVSTAAAQDVLNELVPLVHWMTVWDAGVAVWNGLVQVNDVGRDDAKVEARDPATLFWRTWVPITKTWADTDPTQIGADLWSLMAKVHRMTGDPIALPRRNEKTFTIAATAEDRVLNQLYDELGKVGLKWRVIAGRAVFGEFPAEPVATLTDRDFDVEIRRRRDGTDTYNRVKVKGQNWSATASAPLAGLNMQRLITLDDLGGVSNIQNAAVQRAAELATIRDALYIPAGSSLNLSAEVTLGDLVPGRAFTVYSQGISSLHRLDAVTFDYSPEQFDAQVTLVAVQELSELAELEGQTGG